MGQALYRKYRSRDWSEVVGQEPVVSALQNAVKTGKISHAYLFSGPRGTGKTSVARLLARQINQLDYKSDEPHIDIIEIDAASNTGVDDIRDLREKVSVAPALAKFKVYIIDEVHMLSKSAFNALLKTLEEPPAHVVFILATTDPQKLPETIISRTQHYIFKPHTKEHIVGQLINIARSEKLDFEAEALELIAELGEGSLRDSISMLDQLGASGSHIGLEQVGNLVGLAPASTVETLVSAVTNHDAEKLINILSSAHDQGLRAEIIAGQLSDRFRKLIISEHNPSLVSLAKQLLTVPSSYKPDQLLELVLLDAVLSGENPSYGQPKSAPEPKSKPTTPVDPVEHLPDQVPITHEPSSKPKPFAPASDIWAATLDKLRGHHNTLYGICRMAHAELSGNTISLEFAFPIHLKRANEVKSRQEIAEIVSQVAGRSLSVLCSLNPDLSESNTDLPKDELQSKNPPKQVDSTINKVSSVFGGAELL